jgi:hypothetical protein
MLSAELHKDQIPAIFDQFRRDIDERVWLERFEQIARERAEQPYLSTYLEEQNRVVIALASCSVAAASNANRLPFPANTAPEFLEAFVFAWRAVQLIAAARRISNKRSSILIARVREALRAPPMLKAMQLEAVIATHFVVRGRRVVFPELGSGREKFDVLVEDLGPTGLEIECKVVTHDKGRKLHRREAHEVLHKLAQTGALQSAATSLNRGFAVHVTVPGRLSAADVQALCQGVSRRVLEGTSGELDDGTSVRLIDFDRRELGELTQPPSRVTNEAISRIVGSFSTHSMISARSKDAEGVLVISLDSKLPDSVLHELFQTYADSAGRQLTGRRPGALMSSFEGITSEQLLEVASEDGKDGGYSALALHASGFLERVEFPHVVGLGFIADPDYSSLESASGGTAYWVPKKTSPMWSGDFSGVFGRDPRRPLSPRDALFLSLAR